MGGKSLSLRQVLLFTTLTFVWAWGPRLDTLKRGYDRGSILRASGQDYDPDEFILIQQYRSKLQKTFVSSYEDTGFLGDLLRQDGFENTESLIDSLLQPPQNDQDEELDVCGEDCEDCEIPDDFKVLPGSKQRIDVMEFLGIRRAEPLRIHRDWE